MSGAAGGAAPRARPLFGAMPDSDLPARADHAAEDLEASVARAGRRAAAVTGARTRTGEGP